MKLQRLLVIYNPNSSRYAAVKEEVLARLPELKGYMVGKYAISRAGFEKNVANIAKLVREGDLVMVAGGDGTASIAVNGIIKSGKDAVLAALPYGNFNDLSRTLRTTVDTIFSRGASGRPVDPSGRQPGVVSEERASSFFTRLLRQPATGSTSTAFLYPLEIKVDGKLWRYAPCYVTMGMVAESCELFDLAEVREELQRDKTNKWKPYVHMAKWFFKNRRKKSFMPAFKLNGVLTRKGTSDYAAVNSAHMARVMKGGEDYLKPRVFRSMTEKLTSLPRLMNLMTRSILVRTPGVETKGDVLEFLEDGEVEIQAEGEYRKFKNPKRIEIKKGEKWIRVMQN